MKKSKKEKNIIEIKSPEQQVFSEINSIKIGIKQADRKKITDGLSKFLASSYTLYLRTQNFIGM